ncbi:hypothetical protein [Oryza sativa Japonica Group]|uniref:Uncharacterized protein n=1 Tax=Oryza sativa subsp. japonica TaxID=39947 RepID=Q5N9H4_ORYSJ|nr:hypothetical protein [Oryza sativa Japonica Group]BAD81892.1 hypothetical protein [Oryza sativa Japonica Group]
MDSSFGHCQQKVQWIAERIARSIARCCISVVDWWSDGVAAGTPAFSVICFLRLSHLSRTEARMHYAPAAWAADESATCTAEAGPLYLFRSRDVAG